MNESDNNRFDPESQFMLTCSGNRLPVSTGSPPGDCLRGHSETASPDSTGRSNAANDLTYKLAPTKRMHWQEPTASSSDLEPPSVLKFTPKEGNPRTFMAGSTGIPRVTFWRENLPTDHASMQVRCSYRDTNDLRPPGSHQFIQSFDTSQMRKVQHFTDGTGTRESNTYFAHKTFFTYPAKQSRDVSPTLLSCFPSGCDIRRVSNLQFPPGISSISKSIIK